MTTIEAFCKESQVLDEEAFSRAVEDALAPKLRDKLLDEDEEQIVMDVIRGQKWSRASDDIITNYIEEIVERHHGFLSRKLKPVFTRKIMEGRGQGKTVQEVRVELLAWAKDQSIDDVDEIEEIIDAAAQSPNASPSSAFLGGLAPSNVPSPQIQTPLSTPSMTPAKSVHSQPQVPSKREVHSVSSDASNLENRAIQFIEGRIGNDRFLDLKEEQEYFAWVNDELNMRYEEADRLLTRTLQQKDAARERTATLEFRSVLAGMVDDQYLDSAEVKRAQQVGQSLGLDRSDDGFGLITRIMNEEVQKAGALTEHEANQLLKPAITNLAKGKRISPENLELAVKAVLTPYRLYHNEEAREQVALLAQEAALSLGLDVKARGQGLLIGGGLVLAAGAAALIGLQSPPPSQPQTPTVIIKEVDKPAIAPTSCDLGPNGDQEVEESLRKARLNLENDQLLSPAENCMKRWTDQVQTKLDLACGKAAHLSKFNRSLMGLKRQGRDRYLDLAKASVKSGDRTSACGKWVARAEVFGGGELVDQFKNTHCASQ